MAETKLSVRNLRISFRTSNGRVQAIRGINFDLIKGETLAIVGESGSGKSVTTRAILGIQAANSITEAGEIIYDGKDLLKISEEDFHKIRGDKIAMIFQDPMSSLDPIVKIGKQLTEAMILKGKARQRESRKTFNTHLSDLNQKMIKAIAPNDKGEAERLNKKCKMFDTFEFMHTKLESAYNKAHEAASAASGDIDVLVFELEKNAAKDAAYRIRNIARLSKDAIHEYVVNASSKNLLELSNNLYYNFRWCNKKGNFQDVITSLKKIKSILDEALLLPSPDFFRMGYYKAFSKDPLPSMPIERLNDFLLEYLDNNFMIEFIANAKKALEYSADETYNGMEKALDILQEEIKIFEKENPDAKECTRCIKNLTDAVSHAIDPLAIVKDSLSYTFSSALEDEIKRYFSSVKKNIKAQKSYEKSKAKYAHLVSIGKTPDWEVPEAQVTDLNLVKENIKNLIIRLCDHYKSELSKRAMRDYEKETIALIDFLKECASGVVARVTSASAKARAIRLMEEVGIAEPRKRYNQYPFEFSGGMRQRIVIAIALAANPDILICDEPTTALDVTIQAQILELINKLKEERHLSVIFITHDLGVVANMADRVAVMYAGKIVEYGTSEDIFYHAAHPYTWALLSSMPDLDTNERLEAIPGTPPNMIYPPKGDAFAPRNKYAMQIDFERQPPMFRITDTHYAATWLLHPDAPKVEMPRIIQDRIKRMAKKREE